MFVSIIKDLQEWLAKAGRESKVMRLQNWTAYAGLVDKDKIHLTPRNELTHAMDMDLNLRDWKHFIIADVLVAGGIFSRIASYACDAGDEDHFGTFEYTNATQLTWSGAFFKHSRYGSMEVEQYMNLPASVFGE